MSGSSITSSDTSSQTGQPAHERRMEIAGAYNVRDLGGYPTMDGRATRRGHFIRADRLSALPAQAGKTLCDYGLRTVVDLRTSNETKQWPCTFANHPALEYRRHNLEGDDPLPGYDLGDKHRSLSDSYLVLLDIRRAAVRDVFETLADSSRSPVVFFCAGGTDRTGIISALVLGVAGVPDEVIANDYSLSARGLVDRFLAEGPPPWMPPADLMSGRALAALAHRDTMLGMLQRVRADFGSVRRYLQNIGVTVQQIDDLRKSFVE